MAQRNPSEFADEVQRKLEEEQQRLRNEVEQLREEQQRLHRQQQESNGHPPGGGGQGNAPAAPADQAPATNEQQNRDQKPDEAKKKKRGSIIRRHPIGVLVFAVLLIAALIGGWFLWQYLESYESTDDAQVAGHIDPVSTRISGTVLSVYVEDNQHVKAGQLLIEIDPTDYQTAVAQAQAALEAAEGQAAAANPNVPITQTSTATTISTSGEQVTSAQAGVAGAEKDHDAAIARQRQDEANNVVAQADMARYAALVQKQEISQQLYDQSVARARAAAQAVEADRATVESSQQQIEQARARQSEAVSNSEAARTNAGRQVQVQRATVRQRAADVAGAKAQLDQALLNLSYTKIYAPADGVVGRRTVEVGARLQPGQDLMAVVELRDIWVTADYKETQMRLMRPGQAVTVHVDTYNRDYDAYIEAMPAATGAEFSLLPPENATGNYVKVVQRLPVRVRFKGWYTPDERLRPGMSVETKVWVR